MKRRKFLEAGVLLGGASLTTAPLISSAAQPSPATDPEKKILWMLIADMAHPDLHLVTPAIAWMAQSAGAEFETYQEARRDGKLFARTGSTVLGGHHHQQFNYLNVVFDVRYILLGSAPLFRSSIRLFNAPVLAEADTVTDLYRQLFKTAKLPKPEAAVFGIRDIVELNGKKLELGPYIFPEIYYRKALAFSAAEAGKAAILLKELGVTNISHTLLTNPEKKTLAAVYPASREIDKITEADTYATITLRIAERWKANAKGLAFGDPAAILSQLSSHCRTQRVALYGEKKKLNPAEILVTAYTEEKSIVAEDVKRLSKEIGNLQIVGRQTGDGDLFEWSKNGVCIQIMDPNRPAFPVVETLPHTWTPTAASIYDAEPDDATLLKYLEEGKVLATLMWHSGEMAHNEAMLNLFEVVSETGIKMGMGVHAARYETCPQLWELINIPGEKGGVKGYIEPVLHSGGMGVLAEVNCPPDILRQHCQESLKRINKLAGNADSPRGYYAFMDTDYATLTKLNPDIYKAVETNGLNYVISSISPGRNKILHESGNLIVLNQTSRSICGASPFVRITTVEDMKEGSTTRPGWYIGTLDAPVIAFNHYIWRYGPRFMELVDFIMNNKNMVSATPHTIARYARLMKKNGYLPS